MWTQFILQSSHFVVFTLMGVVFAAMGYLHADAFGGRKSWLLLIRTIGFFLLAGGFLTEAGIVESGTGPLLSYAGIAVNVSRTLHAVGLVAVCISVLADPLVPRPGKRKVAGFALPLLAGLPGVISLPVLSVMTAWGYLRRSTVGLEDHLKPLTLGFFVLSLADILSMAEMFRNTSDPALWPWVMPLGTLWTARMAVVAFAAAVFSRWTLYYLLKQFETQLLLVFTVFTVAIFFVSTSVFGLVIVTRIEDMLKTQLLTNVRVLALALDAKKAVVLSDAANLAQQPGIVQALSRGEKTGLADAAVRQMSSGSVSSILVLSDAGAVLARGEDRERTGDSYSSDPLVKRILSGSKVSAIESVTGPVAPVVSIRAGVPVTVDGKTIGAVVAAGVLDSAFVDGVKAGTGLESTVYGGNRIAATTLTERGTVRRLLDIAEDRADVKSEVLTKGRPYAGSVRVADMAYIGAYYPLKDSDGAAVGMAFVGETQQAILALAAFSLTLTYACALVLLVVSFVPSLAVSRYVAAQMR